MQAKTLLAAFLLILNNSLIAQQFTVSGFIYEKGSRETMPGAVVFCPEQNVGTTTNGFGFYSLTLNPSDVKLIYQLVGYTSQEKTLKLSSNMTIDAEMENAAVLQEVVISADKKEKVSEDSRMSTIDIPIEQIKSIPALLGEKDVLKVIQLMPGVQKGSEGSSGFYVRGGGPDQNLIILDDAVVYNAFHLFGFFSLFNGDALKSVELVKGGFPARYGGRLSSVLEMRMKDGNKEKLKGEAGIGLISSRLTLEGPVVKGKSSFLVSARRTYIDALIYPFLPADQKVGYYFYDLNAKYNHVINDKNRIYVSSYSGKDRFYFRPTSEYEKIKGYLQWGNATGTMRWNHIFNEKTFANASLILTDYKLKIGYQETTTFQSTESTSSLLYTSGIRDWGFKYDVDYHPNAKHYVRFGLATTYHRFSPSAVVLKGVLDDEINQKSEIFRSLESGIYAEDDWSISEKIKVNTGLRVSHYLHENKNYLKPEPRVAARIMLGKDLSMKTSFAIMNQYIHLLSNTGVGLPTDLWVPATKRISPQQSKQYAVGFAKDLPKKNLMITVEGYYKEMNHMIQYKEGASFLMVGDLGGNQTVNWQDNVTSGKGVSYGAEFLVQRKYGKLTGWIGYTLSWTKLQFDELNFGIPFFARYDRRHDISVVGIYKINDRITLSSTWVYGTGQAITLPQATYHLPGNTPGTNFYSQYYVTDYGSRNSFRMAAYHRLDIAIQFHKQLARSERTFELGVYNAYNRKNPYFYSINTTMSGQSKLIQYSLFPIIPSVSWTYKF